MTTDDTWKALAAPLPPEAISWRIDGKPVPRDGKYFARFVAFCDAQVVRERLDDVARGAWETALEPLPPSPSGEVGELVAFKCRLAIRGITREDVGSGASYKEAATDAFKRAAMRFGVAADLWSYDQNWVQVDGDGKYAKPVEDPSVAYTRRHGGEARATRIVADMRVEATERAVQPSRAAERHAGIDPAQPSCPKCGNTRMYDNRAENDQRAARGEKLRPDWKCAQRGCEGVIWRPKGVAKAAPMPGQDADIPVFEPVADDDSLPF